MKDHIYLKRMVLLLCIVFASISAMAVPNFGKNALPYPSKEIWVKLWEQDGGVLDMRLQINNMRSSHQLRTDALSLSTYPFQFDISDLGDASLEKIRGVVYGSNLSPSGQPESPMMIRWWIVKKDQPDPRDPIPPLYPLTLKLRVWDSDATEFNPDRQVATLVQGV